MTIEQLVPLLNNMNLRLTAMEKKVKSLEDENLHLTRFRKPTLEEIGAYAKEIGFKTLDPERFYAFYEQKGWKVGKTPMKDWKGAVRTWKLREPKVYETKSVQEMFGNT